jgi:putative DNA primase/helicase
MRFEEFAYEHGLVIDNLSLDKWMRVKTLDKPNKLNGAYVFDGQGGAVINFATMEKHAIFKSDKHYVIDHDKIKRVNQERLNRQEEARKKAVYIVKSGFPSTHPYLIRKGFTERGLVWKELLVVSMRVGSQLVGCQLIDKDGNKKFLSGQITKGASLVIDNKGRDILVEGYATGLSVRRALKLMKARYKIHICFSASNMLEIAKTLNEPLVVADNDPVGLSTAQKIASCYWVGEAGEDFNDFEVRVGSLVAGESLVSLL